MQGWALFASVPVHARPAFYPGLACCVCLFGTFAGVPPWWPLIRAVQPPRIQAMFTAPWVAAVSALHQRQNLQHARYKCVASAPVDTLLAGSRLMCVLVALLVLHGQFLLQ
jgi:hypothetical protein